MCAAGAETAIVFLFNVPSAPGINQPGPVGLTYRPPVGPGTPKVWFHNSE